jgi:uncharacterized protein involved in exopolysaccharide biosynthesis
MSESIYTDPAAPERGGVRVSDSRASVVESPGFIEKVVRRWWLVAVCIGLGVVGAFAFFAASTKVYTARCVLMAELPPGAGGAATPAGDVAPDDFLFAQRDVIRSTPVLAAAATAMITSDAHVRDALEVGVSKGEGVLTIAYNAAAPDQAALGANAIADAYLRTRARQQTSATSGLAALTKQRDELTAQRTQRETELRDYRQQTAGGAGSDADRAAAGRVEQLQQAMTAAEAQVAAAAAEVAAAKELASDTEKLRAVVASKRGAGIFDRLDQQRAALESELAQLQKQQEKQRETMLAEHPVVIATRRKIEQATSNLAELEKQYAVVYAEHVDQQRSIAQQRVDELRQRIGQQSAQAKDSVAAAAKVAAMEADLKKIDAATAEVDAKIRDATLTSGASAAPTVKVVVPAEAPRRATHPDRDRTIAAGVAIGLLAGLTLAALVPMRGRA